MTSITQTPKGNDQPSGMRALTERRVDPGRNVTNPERVSQPSKLSPPPPRVSGSQKGSTPR